MALFRPSSVLANAVLLAACGFSAHAQERPAQPLWEVGFFGLGASQTAYPGSDTQISRALVLPFFLYRGPLLRADQGSAGLRAIKTDQLELDVGVSVAFGSGADEVEARRGMPELGTLVELGPRLKWTLTQPGQPGWGGGHWRVELPLRGVFDVSDGFARRGLSFEPELVFQRRSPTGFNYSANLSAIVGDRRLADTFYGVAPAYATAARPAYAAKAGLIGWRLGASFSKSLSPDWRLFGFARLDSVSGAANLDSPLVKRNAGGTVGVGLAWTWLRSSRAAVD